MRKFKMDKATAIRTLVLILALVNQSFVMFGFSPMPFTPAEIEAGLSVIFSVAATYWAWWRNNSLTDEAKQADEYLAELKRKGDGK